MRPRDDDSWLVEDGLGRVEGGDGLGAGGELDEGVARLGEHLDVRDPAEAAKVAVQAVDGVGIVQKTQRKCSDDAV